MKSLFPKSSKRVETIQLSEGHSCDVYVWTSPEGVKIATHMIMSCPECSYPLSLATSEFDFETNTLRHALKCPSRWKKTFSTNIADRTIQLAELNEKGKPITQRCGWKGYILDGEVITNKKL